MRSKHRVLMRRVKQVEVGDIVFVGRRLRRIRITRIISDKVFEGVNEKTGTTVRLESRHIHGQSPMSPLAPTVIPPAREIGVHAGCGGKVWYSATRKFGARYCEKCRTDGRYGRPTPLLEDEITV